MGLLSLVLPVWAAPPDFEKDVWPILRRKCYACHNATLKQNGLRLDDGEAALAGGYTGAVIVPGKSAESKLIERVSSENSERRMPKMGAPLSAAEVETLKSWIDAGAVWPKGAGVKGAAAQKPQHWAFRAVSKPAPPAVRNAAWAKNGVDRFVLARLEKEGIAPSPEAAKTTLIRRVSFDLTGLPPTPEEVQAFLADKSPGAYERLVDRLLDSPHYGEKMARFWLDLARYADSDGYEKDKSRPWSWVWRNWVIEAFNRDMPFDRFTVEQLAGDLLPRPKTEQLIAAGFHRNTLTNREGGIDPKETRFEQLVNRTNTTGTVWMGLTVGCAQCHDHKYDPISQKDFYQLYAFFDRSDEVDIDAPQSGEYGSWMRARPGYLEEREHLMKVYEVEALQQEWEEKVRFTLKNPGKDVEWDFVISNSRPMFDRFEQVIATPAGERTERDRDRLTAWFVSNPGPSQGRDAEKLRCLADFRRRMAALDARTPQMTQAPSMMELTDPEPTRLRVKGDYRALGIEVQPDRPHFLPPLPEGAPRNRLTLAQWLASRDNPLTARVMVNRLWQEMFGRGLVRTSEDFGTQGEAPSHPELLDWLASEFMDQGWSVKKMMRTIALSAAYRQSSDYRPELKDRDPDNMLLARQSRVRLNAELVRDAALSASGLLNDAIGGPSVKPPQPEGVAELVYAGSAKWVEDKGPERYRRGLYIHYQRTAPYPMLANFDAPDSNTACSRRRRSNSPLQALNLLNDPVFFEAAQAFAMRLAAETPEERLDKAFLYTLGRTPSAGERARLQKLLDEQSTELAKDPGQAATLLPLKPEAAAWVTASRVLLNLDEFITRE